MKNGIVQLMQKQYLVDNYYLSLVSERGKACWNKEEAESPKAEERKGTWPGKGQSVDTPFPFISSLHPEG